MNRHKEALIASEGQKHVDAARGVPRGQMYRVVDGVNVPVSRAPLSEQMARAVALREIHERSNPHVAYFIERSFGAMVGELVCRQCSTHRDRVGLDADVESVMPLTLGEAAWLGITEGQPPLCDRCGRDVRS